MPKHAVVEADAAAHNEVPAPMGAWAPRRLQARGLSAVASFSRLGVAAARIWSKHRCRSAFHTLVARLLRNDTAAGTGGRRKKQTPGSPPFYIVRAGSFEEHCASLFRAIFTRFEGGDPPRVAHSATDDDDYTRTGLFPSPPSPWIAPPPPLLPSPSLLPCCPWATDIVGGDGGSSPLMQQPG